MPQPLTTEGRNEIAEPAGSSATAQGIGSTPLADGGLTGQPSSAEDPLPAGDVAEVTAADRADDGEPAGFGAEAAEPAPEQGDPPAVTAEGATPARSGGQEGLPPEDDVGETASGDCHDAGAPRAEVAEAAARTRPASDHAKIARHTSRIRTLQQKIAQGERDIIGVKVGIGAVLVELQAVESLKKKRNWTKQVKDLGYHPREASRYQNLGQHWGDKIGTLGSEILGLLPLDIQMLDWICRLPLEDLPGFLAATDCRQWGRKRVIAAVKAALGIAETRRRKPRSPDQILESFGRSVEKLVATVEESEIDVAETVALKAKFHDVLEEAFAEARPGAETSAA
jgi:hypothetical protein